MTLPGPDLTRAMTISPWPSAQPNADSLEPADRSAATSRPETAGTWRTRDRSASAPSSARRSGSSPAARSPSARSLVTRTRSACLSKMLRLIAATSASRSVLPWRRKPGSVPGSPAYQVPHSSTARNSRFPDRMVHDRAVLRDQIVHVQRRAGEGLCPARPRRTRSPTRLRRPAAGNGVVMQRQAVDLSGGDLHHRLGPGEVVDVRTRWRCLRMRVPAGALTKVA